MPRYVGQRFSDVIGDGGLRWVAMGSVPLGNRGWRWMMMFVVMVLALYGNAGTEIAAGGPCVAWFAIQSPRSNCPDWWFSWKCWCTDSFYIKILRWRKLSNHQKIYLYPKMIQIQTTNPNNREFHSAPKNQPVEKYILQPKNQPMPKIFLTTKK